MLGARRRLGAGGRGTLRPMMNDGLSPHAAAPHKRTRRRWLRRTGVAIFSALLVYVALAVRFYSGRPNIARNFTAEFNAGFAATPESERAWPVYREAMLKLPFVADRIDTKGTYSRWPDVPVEGPDAGPVLAYLAEARESISLVHRAAAMPVLGREISDVADSLGWERLAAAGHAVTGSADSPSPNPMLLHVILDHLGSMRELTRLLRADARLAAVQGDGDRAYADIVAILGMADHADGAYGLISQLSSFGIRAIGIQALAETMGIDPDLLTDAQLEDLYRRLAAYAGGARPDLNLDGERNMLLDVAQRLFTDAGAGDGRVCLAGFRNLVEVMQGGSLTTGYYVIGPINALRYGSRREFIAEYDRLIGLFRKDVAAPVWLQSPVWESEREIDKIKSNPDATFMQELVCGLIPAFREAAMSAEMIRMERDAALLGLAAELHRRRTGSSPRSGADLSGSFPNGLPADWIDGQPLRYALRDGRGVVYSLGPDEDDDGGRLPEGGRTARLYERGGSRAVTDALAEPAGRRMYDGDLVLWPRWPAPLGPAPVSLPEG